MKWRVVPLETQNAYMNMALDEAISDGITAGTSPPTIRFYRWQPSAVSIGCFQALNDEVNLEKCLELGVDVVRRRTGGGAVYHDYDGEITYSVIAPESLFPRGITESYHEICDWVVNSLALLGIKAAFKPINDIITNNKKISGNAQTRRRGIILQHGTVLYDLDVRTMFTVLKVGADKISDKMIASVEERVTSISTQSDATYLQAYEALVKGFTANKDWQYGTWQEKELENANALVNDRYKTVDWTAQR